MGARKRALGLHLDGHVLEEGSALVAGLLVAGDGRGRVAPKSLLDAQVDGASGQSAPHGQPANHGITSELCPKRLEASQTYDSSPDSIFSDADGTNSALGHDENTKRGRGRSEEETESAHSAASDRCANCLQLGSVKNAAKRACEDGGGNESAVCFSVV